MNAGILGIGRCLPEKILTNHDLEKIVDTNDEWIRTRTGIEERRIADDDTNTSDLAYEAAVKALENAQISAEEIGLILVATVTPDHPFPICIMYVTRTFRGKKCSCNGCKCCMCRLYVWNDNSKTIY